MLVDAVLLTVDELRLRAGHAEMVVDFAVNGKRFGAREKLTTCARLKLPPLEQHMERQHAAKDGSSSAPVGALYSEQCWGGE